MLASLKKLFSSDSSKHEAQIAYVALVEQSRKPWFYQQQAIPDTVDGRFDVIILHIFLVVHRLRGESSDEAAQFIRALSEAFFSDMDRNLREMGSTDTGVGKRIKKMAQAFYGRLHAYETGMLKEDALMESLKRNLYREDAAAKPDALQALAAYVRRNVDYLRTQPADGILAGGVRFLD